ncbi:MAG: hypothetical protein ACE5GJ_00230 [Gemmatimonadota bacterium]
MSPDPMVAVELRPPPSGMGGGRSLEAWIDLHHALRRLTRQGRFVFLTDNAVGKEEEENLAHVGANVGEDVDLRRIINILTCKHSLEYCLLFAARAAAQGFDAMTVLGGDRSVGAPRCLPHGRDLRDRIRAQVPGMALGGWVNPHRDPREQLGYLNAPDSYADFALTQIVSHHALHRVEALLEAKERMGVPQPLVFGVFCYRSASPRTLDMLSAFFPVPAPELAREFEEGAGAEEICARSVRALRSVGADKVYISNLGNRSAHRRLRAVLEALGG